MIASITHAMLRVMTLCALVCSSALFAQTTGKEILEGREFYFGIPHCDIQSGEGARGNPIQLWISCKVQTRVTITCPRTGMNIGNYVLQPKKVQILPVPQSLMNTITGITDNGVYIKSDDPITVTVYVSYKWTGEAYRVIPAEVLGKRYFTLNMYQDKTERERPAQVLIVATKDNTVVSFAPKTLTEDGTPAGGSKNYRLMRGQTLLIKAKIQPGKDLDWSTDLTGSKIIATNPVAVFSGHTKGAFPRFQATMLGTPANFMRNMMMDAMWPVEFLGKEYFSAPIMYSDRPRANFDLDSWGDLIRIVATEDNTLVYTKTCGGPNADADYQPRYPALKAGQEYRIDSQEWPALYRASKPVLVGQYGKAWRLNQVQGTGKGNNEQNPSRNGQGMMYVLTPEEQWSSYTTFYSPESIDNFVMVTFYTADRGKLIFDGAPINAKFGSYIKQVSGTNKSYIVAPVSSGSHTLEGAKFTAYVYGNWDKSKDGFAYGYPTGVNFSQTCPDTILLSGNMECGVVNGLAAIKPDTSSCSSIYSVELDNAKTTNFKLELDPNFESGMMKTTFTASVIDPSKDGHVRIIGVTRSGKEAYLEYDYVAEAISAKPTVVDYGILAVNTDSSANIKLTNISKTRTVVKNVFLRNKMPQFTFAPQQFPRSLEPGESMTVTVTARTAEKLTTGVKDSVIAELSCYEAPVALLLLSGGTPCVRVSDVVFPPSPVNTEAGPRQCVISNTSKVDATITNITVPNDVTGTKFRHDLKVPFKLAAGQSQSFSVWYTPTDLTTKDLVKVVLETNGEPACTDNESDWSGSGLDAGPKISDYDFRVVRVLDTYNKNVNGVTEYKGTVTIDAFGNDPLQDPRISVTAVNAPAGADATVAIVLNTAGMPTQLFPNNPYSIPMSFRPDIVGDYALRVTLTADFNGEPRVVSSTVLGKAVVPIEDSLGYTFPTTNIGSTAPMGSAVIYNSGSMDLTIKNLSIDKTLDVNSAFEIDPAWMATNLGGGKTITVPAMSGSVPSSISVPLSFTAKAAGVQSTRVVVDCDLDQSEIRHPQIFGKGQPNIKVVPDSLDFGDVPKCMSNTNTTTVKLHNESDVELTISDLVQSGDFAMFEVDLASKTALIGTKIAPRGVSGALTVTFRSPNTSGLERTREAHAFSEGNGVTWKCVGANGEENQQFSGFAGAAVPTSVLVTTLPSNNTGEYRIATSKYNEPTVMEFNLRSNPELVDRAGVTAFHAYIKYDGTVLDPITEVSSIGLTGTLCEGWRVGRVLDNNDVLDVELLQDDKTKTLRGTGTLFTFQMKGFFSLTPMESAILGADMYANDALGCLNIDNLPAVVRFEGGCVSDLRHANVSISGYALMAPNPNPVSSTTQLNFNVGLDAQTTITIYNSLGEVQLVAVNGDMKAGSYEAKLDLSALPAGTYFCRMISGPWTSPAVSIIVQK